ncbi:tetratricopeptide repeat protein [Streptomyces sp. H10-C2]|uniref:tetratricopeptide repeat protein n=1 Tax=unclassified Streptomyces TaxID=2593676 RepID=UPI0024BB6C86|nr:MULTISPECIES: tetratricopeptide repeat protein [unclassified Streptomyces]MDJ0347533.1 tetratricopeptide repeat protein [Streptomyces sp. PH10-H1]MDJ0375452.1 tetratricopeptide repeat protein [Streptomyces sp. H10-C2]
MTSSLPRHCWIDATADASGDGGLPLPPEAFLDVWCHRRLRGPYTGGGSLLRLIVPELMEANSEVVAARATEVVALAPELTPIVPQPPQTLTNLADSKERTRFYPATRAIRLSHGVAELLMDWARIKHPGGVVIAFHDLDEADPTDRDLVAILLRRCNPALLSVIVENPGIADDALGQDLTARALRVGNRPRPEPRFPPDADLAQLFIDSDGTSREPALLRAYSDLPPQERARRHTARAEKLAALGEPTLLTGAIPYHLEHGSDPSGAGVEAIAQAVNGCFALGFYEAVVELSLRGRQIVPSAERPKAYWNFTHKIGACLSYLGRGDEAIGYLEEMRQGSTEPDIHMGTSYLMAMLHTRFLPEDAHDENVALAWVNTAIAIADIHPDPRRRILVRAFMRNARALVELHRGNLDGSLALVNEAMAITDADFGPDEQLLHRSVLLYNRAQVQGGRKDHAASLLDYDEVIRRDPDYGDYYFERAAQHRAAGQYAQALDDYAAAIRLSPPFHEAHFNRADLLRELGDDEAALRDLDYALDIEPDHVDSIVNRADLLLACGEMERARADIERGLALDPRNVNLLAAQGSLLADSGDTEGAYAKYTAALAEDPAFVAAWANRAVLAYSTDRPAQAVADLDEAIRLTDDPALRANRAIALQELGHHDRAIEDLDTAIAAIGDQNPELLYRRGVSRQSTNDTAGALDDWRAHLAAYGPGETSPYLKEIELQAGDLIANRGQTQEGVM